MKVSKHAVLDIFVTTAGGKIYEDGLVFSYCAKSEVILIRYMIR
jgi:hypothetical protein